MFCTNCGTQLPDEAKFCTNCGTSLNPVPVAEEPVVPVAEEPVYVPVEEPAVQEPVYQEPVYQEPVYQEPVYQEPVYQEPVYQEPVYQAPAEEPVTYADPVPPAPKKKKKTGLIIGIILLVLAVAAAGVLGFLYFQDQKEKTAAYEDAEAKLAAKNYEGALAGFQALENFSDAADRAAELTELQESYDAAMALLDEHKYEDAIAAFKKLKDYRDSQDYVNGKATYLKGVYFMQGAAAADVEAWSVMSGEEAGDQSQYSIMEDLYLSAIDIFNDLGEYEDSAELVSECWLGIAMMNIEQGQYPYALGLTENMNEEDAAAVQEAYDNLCVDNQVLAAMEEALIVWYDGEEVYNAEEEINAALAILDQETFADGEYKDEELYEMYKRLLSTLNSVYLEVDGDNVEDWLGYYEALISFYDVTGTLCQDFGLYAENADMYAYYTESQDLIIAYYVIESSLQDWYNNIETIPYDDDLGYYVSYYNNTGYDMTLYIQFTYKDEYYNILGTSDWTYVDVHNGEEVMIPTGELPDDTNYLDWTWAYTLIE